MRSKGKSTIGPRITEEAKIFSDEMKTSDQYTLRAGCEILKDWQLKKISE